MDTKDKKKTGLFEEDRRAKMRLDAPERRTQLRATPKLKIYGFLIAAICAVIACVVGYMAK